MSVLSAPHFHHEQAAYDYVEARLWRDGPFCPHCGECERIGKLAGKSTRIGVRKCYSCRKPFTVKVGTIFEASHVPMRHWLQAMFLMASNKKGISANQLHRTLGCTLKTAWFIEHRIREAMSTGALEPFGSGGTAVEADETFIGMKPGAKRAKGVAHKNTVLTVVDRETGRAKSQVVANTSSWAVGPAIQAVTSPNARLITDEGAQFKRHGQTFASHESVNHSRGEYVRDDVHTNTVEGTFSIFKRGMRGVYQHCATKHLHRYLAEFDFRYSNRKALGVDDVTRADEALRGVRGKRLTYRRTCERVAGGQTRVVW